MIFYASFDRKRDVILTFLMTLTPKHDIKWLVGREDVLRSCRLCSVAAGIGRRDVRRDCS